MLNQKNGLKLEEEVHLLRERLTSQGNDVSFQKSFCDYQEFKDFCEFIKRWVAYYQTMLNFFKGYI